MYQLKVCSLCFETEYLPASFREFLCSAGEPVLSIKESAEKFHTDGESVATPANFSVFREGDHWLLETNKGEQLWMNTDYSLALLYIPDKTEEEVDVRVTLLLRILLECRLSFEGFVSLHSACVEKDGKAFAFTGESGKGKSTRARKWHEELDASWISGDRPLVDTRNGVVYGAPWDGKEQFFHNVNYPLNVILDVRRSMSTRVRRLSKGQALRVLFQQCFLPMWDTEVASIVMGNIYMLADKVPVLRLNCDRWEDSARETYHILRNEPKKIGKEETDMKINEGFTLRKVAGEFMIMPTGNNVAKFDGAVALNEVSAFIYEKLTSPVSKEELLTAILEEYEVEPEVAAADLENILNKFREYGVLDEQE